MILKNPVNKQSAQACPHTRGDDPHPPFYIIIAQRLVPTRVGMIPVAVVIVGLPLTCPHTRGDDPFLSGDIMGGFDLSPHAWG